MPNPSTTIKVGIAPTVPVGPATQIGLSAAAAQFAGAIVLLITGDHSAEAIGALATATATLITVLLGRYLQAKAAIEVVHPLAQAGASASSNATPDDEIADQEGVHDLEPHDPTRIPADVGDATTADIDATVPGR